MNDDGGRTVFEMSAVLVPVSRTRASIMFVDNRARVVYGQWYVENYDRDGLADRLAVDVMTAMRAAYDGRPPPHAGTGQTLPSAAQTVGKIKAVIGSKVQRVQPES